MEKELHKDLAKAKIFKDQAKTERNIKPERPSFNEDLHKLQRKFKQLTCNAPNVSE